MRLWNGIVTGDVVEYQGTKYVVTKVYKLDEKGVLNLHSPSGDLEGIIAHECKKIK